MSRKLVNYENKNAHLVLLQINCKASNPYVLPVMVRHSGSFEAQPSNFPQAIIASSTDSDQYEAPCPSEHKRTPRLGCTQSTECILACTGIRLLSIVLFFSILCLRESENRVRANIVSNMLVGKRQCLNESKITSHQPDSR